MVNRNVVLHGMHLLGMVHHRRNILQGKNLLQLMGHSLEFLDISPIDPVSHDYILHTCVGHGATLLDCTIRNKIRCCNDGCILLDLEVVLEPNDHSSILDTYILLDDLGLGCTTLCIHGFHTHSNTMDSVFWEHNEDTFDMCGANAVY